MTDAGKGYGRTSRCSTPSGCGVCLALPPPMQIPLQITFHEIPHSDSVEQYVRRRATKLDAQVGRITRCRVTLEKPQRHALHGDNYRVRVNVSLPGGEVVASRTPDADPDFADLYAAVDAAFECVIRSVHEFTRRRRAQERTHVRP